MRTQLRADAAMAGTILLLGAVLALTGSVLVLRWFSGSGFRHPPRFEEAIGAVSAAVGFAVVLWWLLAFVLAVIAGLLQRTGRRQGADATGRLAPAFMRRLVLALLGANLLCTPLAHAADEPINPLWQPGISAVLPARQGPTPPLRRPLQDAPGTSTPTATAGSIPAPYPAPAPVPLPAAGIPSEARSIVEPISPLWQPQAPPVAPGLLAPVPSRAPSGFNPLLNQHNAAADGHPASAQSPNAPNAPNAPTEGEGTTVVVKAGDSLWTLAAGQLGPLATDAEIARQWPAWFRVNRSIIGADPALILPGQILRAP